MDSKWLVELAIVGLLLMVAVVVNKDAG